MLLGRTCKSILYPLLLGVSPRAELSLKDLLAEVSFEVLDTEKESFQTIDLFADPKFAEEQVNLL